MMKNKYPLLCIDDLFDQLCESHRIYMTDLRLSYHQLRVREEDISKTVLRTKYGILNF
jgi:recombinational DNA repair ATPase RecF